MAICHFFKQCHHKANLRDLIAATGLAILLKLDKNNRLISLCDLEIWWMTSKNNKAPLLYYIKLCASFQIHWWIQTGVTIRKCSMWVKIGDFFVLPDLEIWWMILKNKKAPLLYYIKLCAAFPSHWHIQTGVTVQKRSIQVKIGNFLSRVTLKIDVWPWKQLDTSSIQRQALCITSNPLVKSNLSYSLETLKLGKNCQFFFPHDLENWRMTVKTNRAPLLCCFNLCASFHSQWQIKTGATVRKWPIWVKIDDFLAVWPWNLTDDLEEQ